MYAPSWFNVFTVATVVTVVTVGIVAPKLSTFTTCLSAVSFLGKRANILVSTSRILSKRLLLSVCVLSRLIKPKRFLSAIREKD